MDIFCIHGIAGSARYFSRLVVALTKAGHRVHAFDLPGYGLRQGDRTEPDIKFFLDDIEVQIASTRVGMPVVLIGHSFGAVLALAFAAAHPGKVSRLVLLNAPWAHTAQEMYDGLLQAQYEWSYFLEFFPQTSRVMCALLCKKKLMKLFRFLKPAFIPAEVFDDYTKHEFIAVKNTFAILSETPTTTVLASLSLPTLIVVGSKESAIFHAPTSPAHAHTVQVEAGHHALLEQLEQVESTIINFLETEYE